MRTSTTTPLRPPSLAELQQLSVEEVCADFDAMRRSQGNSSAVTLSSRDWMAAALLPDAAVFTARSVS